jgi:hypothetical protein
MKICISFLLPIAIVCPLRTTAQETAASGSIHSRPALQQSLNVPDFSPPAPKPAVQVPKMRVDARITVAAQSSRLLTLIRGEASTLPDIPPPQVVNPRPARSLTPEQIARNIYQRRHRFNFGATVYDQRVSQVHWNHPDTGESYEAVCGFDISLLSGIGRFAHYGEFYDFSLTAMNISTTAIQRAFRLSSVNIPDVPLGTIAIIKGDRNDALGIQPITLIKELIANEKSHLFNYQKARMQHQKAAAAWEKAHPVKPKDETFWFRPHRGSRYLANPKPEAAAQ